MTSSDADDDISGAAALFRSLGDPSRLAILHHLRLGEHRVVELTEHLGLAQSTVSTHLASLRSQGLVTSRAEGRASLFSLARTEALADLLAAAEHLRQG
ncbi:metalloregulator ArsR/SmtB family transcription factor [Microbacterium amylolyticum]|uniref:DNA-binding transcriptional ArsR family regulator n=1 Tax=Microbacterium amylolyticum TaxID=936337 RepID=A0ABS4ZK27_9MICO|nr:DNA-binding transcriptional ArsR family regulator [Microbacterium amylolyticum]